MKCELMHVSCYVLLLRCIVLHCFMEHHSLALYPWSAIGFLQHAISCAGDLLLCFRWQMCRRRSASVRMPSCCQESLRWANTQTKRSPSCTQSPRASSHGLDSTGRKTTLALHRHRSCRLPSQSVFQSRYVLLLRIWVGSMVQPYVWLLIMERPIIF